MAITDLPPQGLQDRTQAAPAGVTRPDGASPVRHIALMLDPSCLRLAHRELAQRLVNQADVGVSTSWRAERPAPPSLDLLLTLERLVHRITGPRLTDRIERHDSIAGAFILPT